MITGSVDVWELTVHANVHAHLNQTMTTWHTIRCCWLYWWHCGTKRLPSCVTARGAIISLVENVTASHSRTRHLATKRRWSSPLDGASDGLLSYATAAAEQSIPSLGIRRPVRPSNNVCWTDGRAEGEAPVGRFVSTSTPVCRLIACRRKVVAVRCATVLNASALDSRRTRALSLVIMLQIAVIYAIISLS